MDSSFTSLAEIQLQHKDISVIHYLDVDIKFSIPTCPGVVIFDFMIRH